MKLNLTQDEFDAIEDQGTRELYERHESEHGDFTLSEAVNLVKTLQKERTRANDLERQVKTLEGGAEGEEIRALQTELERDRRALSREREEFESERSTMARRGQLNEIMQQHNAIPELLRGHLNEVAVADPDDPSRLVLGVVNTETGQMVPKKNEDGSLTPMADYVGTLSKDPKYAGVFLSTQRGGGGSTDTGRDTDRGGPGVTGDPSAPPMKHANGKPVRRSELSKKEKAGYIRAYGHDTFMSMPQ